MKYHLILVATVVFSVACSGGKSAGGGDCSANSDCPSGAVCDGGTCKVLCAADAECGDGLICDGTTCVAGSRAQPSISRLDGDGSIVCPDGQGSHCVEAGLIVGGLNLEGATFELLAAAGGSVTLPVRTGATDTYAELDLPSDVAAGAHTLRVSNGAGTADQTFQLIQGPAGPPGADGSPDTAAQVLAKLVSVDGSGSGLDADSLDGMQAADIQASLDALSAQMSTLVPPGTIAPFAGSTVPEGWLLCDGSEIDRTQYPELFAAIGVTHGGGDLINTFHLPDLRGRFLRGVDGGTGRDPDAASRAQAQTGGNSGDAVGSIQGDSYASHTHPNTWARVHDCSSSASGTNSSFWSGNCSRAQETSTQASGGNENRPKNVSVSFIIKY